MSVPPLRRDRARRSVLRPVLALAALAAAVLAGGCALAPPGGPRRDASDGFRFDHPGRWVRPDDLDLRLAGRERIESESGEPLLRLEFSFVAYDGYVGEDDVLVSTGTLYLPLDADGKVRTGGSRVLLITEYPPGTSRSVFPFLAEYGEEPAALLGVPSAVVDIRGPVVSRLRGYVNPDDPQGGVFTSEEQFAYSMLRSYQDTDDEEYLWEYQAAGAWLRAIRAVTALLESESDDRHDLVLLCGERYGALAAVQAAVADDRVAAVAMAGWPLSWSDYHIVRDSRWEWESRYRPLDAIQPTAYRDSREVLSFLRSTRLRPDPGCPGCAAGGDEWMRQYDIATLRAERRLGAAVFLLEGDEDPDFPIDLTARAAVGNGTLALPRGRDTPASGGPFAQGRITAYEDLRVLRGGSSRIARADAAEAVRAWTQTLDGFRDIPVIHAVELLDGGDLRVTVSVQDGNARTTGISVRMTETTSREDVDFKAPLHRDPPGEMEWYDVPQHYGAGASGTGAEWTARIPLSAVTNQAYVVSVRSQAGDLETEHSLPIRPLQASGYRLYATPPWDDR
jgi:hypothetical protein